MTVEDLKLMASSVLLATLSILPYDRQERHQDEMQVEQEKERIVGLALVWRGGGEGGEMMGNSLVGLEGICTPQI